MPGKQALYLVFREEVFLRNARHCHFKGAESSAGESFRSAAETGHDFRSGEAQADDPQSI